MKTRFSRRHPSFLTPGRIGLGVGGGVIFILLVLRLLFPGALTTLMSPLWQVGDFLSAQMERSEQTEALERERAYLKEQNAILENEKRILQSAVRDQNALQGTGVIAGVLARPPVTAYDVLVINKGTHQGVVVGARVYAMGGIPVGIIADAGSSSSRVALYSSSGRTTEGWVGEERYPVSVVGIGAGAFQVDVPREAPVKEGDILYFPGPGALPVGSVVRIESNASSPQAKLHIRPLVSVFSISSVAVSSALP